MANTTPSTATLARSKSAEKSPANSPAGARGVIFPVFQSKMSITPLSSTHSPKNLFDFLRFFAIFCIFLRFFARNSPDFAPIGQAQADS
jgi:hypothetical protein